MNKTIILISVLTSVTGTMNLRAVKCFQLHPSDLLWFQLRTAALNTRQPFTGTYMTNINKIISLLFVITIGYHTA